MQYRVYSGPKGSGEISPIAKEQMLFKEFAALDDALSWARHRRRARGRPARAGRPLSSEGSSGSQALAGDPGPFDAGALGELLPFGADHVPIDHWPLHAGRRVRARERVVRVVEIGAAICDGRWPRMIPSRTRM